mgnify:CR=1 FL=1
MKRIYLILLCLAFVFSLSTNILKAQNASIHWMPITGSVKDAFTHNGIQAEFVILNEDSSLVMKGLVLEFGGRAKHGNEIRAHIPAIDGKKYIFRITAKGYETQYINYEIKKIGRKRKLRIPDILMKRKKDKANEEKEAWEKALDEVTVKATKIKMLHKGDTLIYNADAFNMPEGSMLEDLIRQLPGAILKDNGEIFVNGRKIETLLLNSKDFFGRNSKIMLENLPYYTVNQIKVYDISTNASQALGHDVEAKIHVMDVTLKREYSIGYLGNAEAAGGTENRYMGRLFGLQFADNWRFGIFGNANNVNESRKPGENGDWSPSSNPIGTQKTENSGIDFLYDDGNKYENKFNATFSKIKTDNEQRSLHESYLTSGSIFDRSHNRNSNWGHQFNMQNEFILKLPVYLNLRTTIGYNRNERTSVEETTHDSLSHSYDKAEANNKNFSFTQSVRMLKALPWGDDIDFGANGGYERTWAHEHSLYHLNYNDSTQNGDYRNRRNEMPKQGYNYSAYATYILRLPKEWNLKLTYQYAQRMEETEETRYRIEQTQHLDEENSYKSNLKQLDHKTELHLGKEIKDSKKGVFWKFWFSMPLTVRKERLDYKRHTLDTIAQRTTQLLDIRTVFSYRREKTKWGKIYTISSNIKKKAPEITWSIPYRDTYNPLTVFQGARNLKDEILYGASVNFNQNRKGIHWMNLAQYLIFTKINNSTTMGYTYDPMTGVYTVTPQNINGNWNTWGGLDFNMPLDSAGHFILDSHISSEYDHQTRQTSLTGFEPEKIHINNCKTNGSLKLGYHKGTLRIDLTGELTWRMTNSRHENFTSANAFEYKYGIGGICILPWKLQLATDIKMYSRRGYTDKLLNSDDWVWNASLSRSIMKGKLLFKLEGFDILNQLRNVTYTIDEWGRTETWFHSIPRYTMLHVIYKFHINPKQKI